MSTYEDSGLASCTRGEMIRMEISELLVRELKDPRIGLTTVTEVKMSPDLKQARVYVSVLGGTEERQKL